MYDENGNLKQEHQQDNGETAIAMGVPVGIAGLYLHRKANNELNSINEYNSLKTQANDLKNKISVKKYENQQAYNKANERLQGLDPNSEEFKSVVKELPNGDSKLSSMEDTLKKTYTQINNHHINGVTDMEQYKNAIDKTKGRAGLLMGGGALLAGTGLASHFLNNKGNK